MTTFQELGIRASLCDVLRNHGIKEATPVQEKAMPLVRAGSDCIVKAQTGTGKTLAFLLPIIEKIKPQAAVTQALVITPTRELAIQIAKVAQSLAAAADISSLVIFGKRRVLIVPSVKARAASRRYAIFCAEKPQARRVCGLAASNCSGGGNACCGNNASNRPRIALWSKPPMAPCRHNSGGPSPKTAYSAGPWDVSTRQGDNPAFIAPLPRTPPTAS